ncbi:hypothetical protein SISSUDRAFT_1047911 [Sistotremastrum suecicum HHB10207 ss-3]|uniref:Uncharacterized protein n=1 Tax=Sistotremastrum suecicum HHB10207 ss-3 TaxID=1314776 RepID=A0A166CUK2_9AGAM|nr:hypothetical protein SISSUDRAFT_1047911 [Sistotremastrum suecicum HHB10207 ss-3]
MDMPPFSFTTSYGNDLAPVDFEFSAGLIRTDYEIHTLLLQSERRWAPSAHSPTKFSCPSVYADFTLNLPRSHQTSAKIASLQYPADASAHPNSSHPENVTITPVQSQSQRPMPAQRSALIPHHPTSR